MSHTGGVFPHPVSCGLKNSSTVLCLPMGAASVALVTGGNPEGCFSVIISRAVWARRKLVLFQEVLCYIKFFSVVYLLFGKCIDYLNFFTFSLLKSNTIYHTLLSLKYP